MAELRRRMLMSGGNGEYEFVQYIESTGTQYINVGRAYPQGWHIYLDMHKIQSLQSKYSTFWGNDYYTGPYRRNYLGDNGGSDTINQRHMWNIGRGNGWYLGGISDNDHHVVEASNMAEGVFLIVDGQSVTLSPNGSPSIPSNPLPVYLFADNRSSSPASPSHLRLYECKIYSSYDSSVMDFHFVPAVRKSDGAVGMVDLMGNPSPFDGTPFYGNSGTGSFLHG